MDPNTTPAEAADKAKDKAQDVANQAQDKAQQVAGQAKDEAQQLASKAQDYAGEAQDKVQEYAKVAQDKAQEYAQKAQDYVKDLNLGEQYDKLSTNQKIIGGAAVALGLTLLLSGGGKKKKAKRQVAILDQLLLYVNDRIQGYKQAASASKDARYQEYYQHLARQSRDFSAALNGFLAERGGKPETGTTWKGKFHRRYLAAKSLVTGHDEKAILDSNIYGEKFTLKSYKKALRHKAIDGGLSMVIKHQLKLSKKTLSQLRELKDKAA